MVAGCHWRYSQISGLTEHCDDRNSSAMLEPAHNIITICGGFEAVAAMTQRSEVRVRRWTYPKDRGGTGGLIPSDVQQVLMAAARERGIPLRPEHFFPESAAKADPAQPTADAA
jgi:hypothetical protein